MDKALEKKLEDEVEDDVEELRDVRLGKDAVDGGRRAQQAFRRMILENRRSSRRRSKRPGKHPDEAFATEINPVLGEIQHVGPHGQWAEPVPSMSPFEYPVLALTGHGRAAIYSDPLGVVLVIGAWNYPFLLTLTVVGARGGQLRHDQDAQPQVQQGDGGLTWRSSGATWTRPESRSSRAAARARRPCSASATCTT